MGRVPNATSVPAERKLEKDYDLAMAKDINQFRNAEARLWEHVGVAPLDRRIKLASGGEVRVQEVGDGPPVVFIHGTSVGGASWCHLAAGLDGLRCILIDRPGCGLSEPIVGGPLRDLAGIEAYADQLLPDVLDALELDQAAVAATSYGGFFAFRGAAAAPERVTKLVEYSWLIGAPSESAPLTVRMGALPGMQALTARMPMSRGMVKTALRLLRHTNTLINEGDSSPQLFTPIKGQNDDVLLTDELLSKLTMPVLFLWGEEDPNGGAAIARSFAPRLPNAELVVVAGAEHAPWFDDPATCLSRTQEFLTGQT